MIDSWDWLTIGRACESSEPRCPGSTPQSLLLKLQMAKMAAFVSSIYWLHFCIVGGSRDVLFLSSYSLCFVQPN